ncbi:sigma-70 family RNA polymerase sigma factor [Saccharopolyspora sp. HNM0983]|uniref:Sigma-70 family RNA polymerase sigma factor n=1 Tax=Saccharopolyspora montiporae TaxID=2781240 RepID=A0A929BBU5_9PSEU|nr:sigma-70 family RNA polymerase sigma factor [Saccharopolyspora sp. HNM0983]MBE9375146.1 sigma-70 family RNA polymerase sigma factor [Saccharopolyspora sp. HNM0983]
MAAGAEADLLAAVRAGSGSAYAELYRRHVAAARGTARPLAPSPADAEDLVAEAFARILSLIRRGGGPDAALRPYLLVTVRNLAAAAGNRRRRLVLTADVDDESSPQLWEPFEDVALAEFERSAAAAAFRALPRRWRRVLWCVEVEGMPLPDVAQRFGISRNSAAALSYRARKGLREAYWQAEQEPPARHGHSTPRAA